MWSRSLLRCFEALWAGVMSAVAGAFGGSVTAVILGLVFLIIRIVMATGQSWPRVPGGDVTLKIIVSTLALTWILVEILGAVGALLLFFRALLRVASRRALFGDYFSHFGKG